MCRRLSEGFLPSQGLFSASVPCLPYSWKSEKHKKIEALIQSHKLDELVSTQKLAPLEPQKLEGEWRHEKFKAGLRYMEAILGYISMSSQVTERRNKRTRERKKKGSMKEEMQKAKWKERTEEKDVVSLTLTSSPRETSRSPHPSAALHTANSFSVQFTLGLS